MKQVYPVFIAQQGKDYLVYVPDMDIYTEGTSLADAIDMARDAIGLKGIDLEDDHKKIPLPSDYQNAALKAKIDTGDFDYTSGILTLVDIDFSAYRKMKDKRAVRRNVTLPYWLNVEADRLELNVSRVLQEALAEKVASMK